MFSKTNKWFGFVFLFLLLISGRVLKGFMDDPRAAPEVVIIDGFAQGTSFHIKYLDLEGRSLQQQVDSVFQLFDQAFSSWEPASEINQLNKVGAYQYKSPYFYPVLLKSKEVYEATGGAFDPTIAPLVGAWGFGPEGVKEIPADLHIDSLRRLVGFRNISFDTLTVHKKYPEMQMDFNAIAPGYTVDVLAALFKGRGITDFFIEVGGEVYASGVNQLGEAWRVGINTPSEKQSEQQDIQVILQLKDRAVTTSGNYRKFYEQEGVKYSHTISPYTGRPVRHSLLSATVLAPDCMTADAYATAFMVVGVEKAIEIVKGNPQLSVILIYSNSEGGMETYISPELNKSLIKNNIKIRESI